MSFKNRKIFVNVWFNMTPDNHHRSRSLVTLRFETTRLKESGMNRGMPIVFGPFRLEPGNAMLWRGDQAIVLRPRTFAVLCYLLEHPNRLLTKTEILNALWPRQFVSEGVLKASINEIRKALGDDPKAPRYIETRHRQGYRFIGPRASHPPPTASALPSTWCVGRDAELKHLHAALEKALAGERQLVFVTGEAGIGKTTVVEVFAEGVAAQRELLRMASGQCVEHYGPGEAYLPVLEALVRRQQFLERRETAEWPDGTMAGRYGFRHVLYRDALSGRLTAKRRVRLHQAIGWSKPTARAPRRSRRNWPYTSSRAETLAWRCGICSKPPRRTSGGSARSQGTARRAVLKGGPGNRDRLVMLCTGLTKVLRAVVGEFTSC
jgi:DNA-binding winged helix-turn-helix (wHTH) protein